jgi:hypothetical protein
MCGKADVNSVTLCHPFPYGQRAAPSKEDGGALKKGMDAYRTPAQDNAVTSDQWSASPPSPPALCGHPRRCAAILGAVGARDDKTLPRPQLCNSRPSVSRTLESAYGRRPNGKFPYNHP